MTRFRGIGIILKMAGRQEKARSSMAQETLKLKNERETMRFGRRLAESAKPGTVIALTGDLGAGKTTLTKAIAAGLGVQETVTSPTFTIVREYRSGRLPLFHFDVYRVGDIEEMYELGYEEYFYDGGVCVVEWADLIEEILPEDAVKIHITYGENEEERICECIF